MSIVCYNCLTLLSFPWPFSGEEIMLKRKSEENIEGSKCSAIPPVSGKFSSTTPRGLIQAKKTLWQTEVWNSRHICWENLAVDKPERPG